MHHGPQLKLRSSTAQPAFLRPTCHGKDRVAKSLNPSEQTTETCERLITQLHSISWSKEVPLRRSWIHSGTHPSSIAAGSTLAPLKSFSRISIQTFWWIVDTYGTYRIRILQNSKMQDIPQWCFFMFFWWVLELHCYFQTKGIQCCDTVQVPGHYWWSCIFPPKFQFFTLFHTAILQIFPFSHFCFNHRQSRSRSWGDGGPQQIATCQGLISKTCAPMNSENITNRTVENQAKRFRCFKKELSQGPSRSFLYLAFVCWYGRSLSSLFRHSLRTALASVAVPVPSVITGWAIAPGGRGARSFDVSLPLCKVCQNASFGHRSAGRSHGRAGWDETMTRWHEMDQNGKRNAIGLYSQE